MVLSFSAAAHLRSFISLQSEPMVKDGLLSGLKTYWTTDEITSSDPPYDAGNAEPGSEVRKKLAAEVMANVLGQRYFSELWHNGQRVKFEDRPDGYGLERDGLQAVLTLTLSLVTSQPIAGQTFTFSASDPTYYIDMFHDKNSDSSLLAALWATCEATVMAPKPDGRMLSHAQSLDKVDVPPEDMAPGSYFAQKMTLTRQ